MPVMILSKKLLELRNNRIFRNAMETLRNKVNIKLATNYKDYQNFLKR